MVWSLRARGRREKFYGMMALHCLSVWMTWGWDNHRVMLITSRSASPPPQAMWAAGWCPCCVTSEVPWAPVSPWVRSSGTSPVVLGAQPWVTLLWVPPLQVDVFQNHRSCRTSSGRGFSLRVSRPGSRSICRSEPPRGGLLRGWP